MNRFSKKRVKLYKTKVALFNTLYYDIRACGHLSREEIDALEKAFYRVVGDVDYIVDEAESIALIKACLLAIGGFGLGFGGAALAKKYYPRIKNKLSNRCK